MFGLFDDEEEDKKEELRKVKNRNNQAIAGLKRLNDRLGQQADLDAADAAAQRRFLDRLRREGTGQ